MLYRQSAPAGGQQNANRTALATLIALWGLHVYATWGQVGLFGGDYARWLHEIDRFAHGEVPYRDYYWAFPPMSAWVLGSIGRVFGSQLAVMSAATVLLSLLIYVAFFIYASQLIPQSLLLETVLAGVVLSAAYAQVQSVPLPIGMYSPAVPLGFLLLLCALLASLHNWRHPRNSGAALVGLLGGLCILTKQDFWIPALYLVIVGAFLQPSQAWATAATFFVTVLWEF